MINISSNKQLDIILPNTNKALKEVLQSVSPKQLQLITQNKDLKSVINSLLKESSQNSANDKALLQLVKENPTLKNLGNVSNTIKDLLKSLDIKSNPTTQNAPLPIEKVLKSFLLDMKQLSEGTLKDKITNSGVFLESKLKNVQNPQVELRDALKTLQPLIEKSSVFPVKILSKNIQALLLNPTLKDASNATLTQTPTDAKQALTQLSKGVEKIIQTLQSNIKEAGDTNSKTLATQLLKLDHLTQTKMLTPENFKLASIQDALQQMLPTLTKSSLPEAKGLLDALAKVLQLTPNTSLEKFVEKRVPQELQNAMQPLKSAINKTDSLFSKELGLVLNELTKLNTPQKLSAQQNIKEIVENDLKSILLKANDEIAKSSHPNQAEILKNIDKLSLQIDYYQLMSHLSNSSSLYLPFSWDELQEGNIKLKKGEEDKFYCDIELKLKEYGELHLRLVLYEENQLNIQIHSDNQEFKNIIKQNISSLRSALIEAHITPREIRILDATKKVVTSAYNSPNDDINVGFEIKA
jgi:hypothetical protein